ncbi:unnamed protein product [Symbiodinium natans]|uniref:C3H1-type domain-containing protein n=1 Tax=Symbiodinium natans TaxID=878477 RepID=A0A812HD29_9DINO|nr:unnamed protein product [Symbiodinium natans]
MALELEYRATFIDVYEDPFELSGSLVRSSSAPATYRRTLECDAEFEERQLKSYVDKLSRSLEELSQEVSQKGAQGYEAQPAATEGDEVQPEVCRRPCVYFNRGFCQNGATCTFCHYPHSNRGPKLDKNQRSTLDEITKAQLLTLVLHFLRERAVVTGMPDEAAGVLAVFEEELRFWCGGADVAELDESAMDTKTRKLAKVMGRMSFGALLSMASHRLDRDQFQRHLSQAMETLRRSGELVGIN